MNKFLNIILGLMLILSIHGYETALAQSSDQVLIPDSLMLIKHPDIRYHLTHSDEAHFALLNPRLIVNESDWRDLYSKQICGYGIRTAIVELSNEDRDMLKKLLLESLKYENEGGVKLCAYGPDAVAFFRDPKGETTILFELWCARLTTIDGITLKRTLLDVDPINEHFRELAKKYFPGDEYLKTSLK